MNGFIGEIRGFGGNFAPRAWAFCEGQLLPIAQNTALFSILGTTYGGDGRTTFQLPDLRGRVPVGSGNGPGLSSRQQGAKFGTETNTLTVAQMPAHNHSHVLNLKAAPGDGTTGTADGNALAHEARGNSVPDIYNAGNPSIALKDGSASLALANTGGNQPMNNMQPTLAVYYIICLQGTFPSRS